jgi:hypothetical protein
MFLSILCPHIAFPAFFCGKYLPNKPPDILQPKKFEDNDVLVAIVCAILISQVAMEMMLVSMLKYQQKTLFFMSII